MQPSNASFPIEVAAGSDIDLSSAQPKQNLPGIDVSLSDSSKVWSDEAPSNAEMPILDAFGRDAETNALHPWQKLA
jgi:hypothetical protein